MKVRIVDYVGNSGGGLRFAVEMVRALTRVSPDLEVELVSHGPALRAYEEILRAAGLDTRIADIPPASGWRNSLRTSRATPLRVVRKLLPSLPRWGYEVTAEVFRDCDVVWFPWVHQHGIPGEFADRAIGSFHDTILFRFPEIVPDPIRLAEAEITRRWLDSKARIAVSSRTTAEWLRDLFGSSLSRVAVLPLSGEHAHGEGADGAIPADWSWACGEYLLCPANIVVHKNHEVMLDAVARWGCRYPLVLTGAGTDLTGPGRARSIRTLAERLGFQIGKDLIPLGYVSNEQYYALLRRARCLIMPTLAEGGGSFPVWEAMTLGIPVICSDIPILREQMSLIRGRPTWFDPTDAATLAGALSEFEADYDRHRNAAIEQVGELNRRAWTDVANAYLELFRDGPGYGVGSLNGDTGAAT